METKEILYFSEPGPSHTDKVLELSIRRIEALGIRHVVIAAMTGSTVRRFLDISNDRSLNVVVVTSAKETKMPVSVLYSKYEESKRIKEDYVREGTQYLTIALPEETCREFEKEGLKVFYVPDILGIGGRAPEGKGAGSRLDPFIPGHLRPLDIEAGADLSLLNILSMGFRVCVGITVIAAKNSLLPEGETVLSIAGTGFAGGGADTAVVLRAGKTANGCLVKEVLAFPTSK